MALLSGEAIVLLLLLTLTPGPDTFLTLRQALTGGLRRAVPTIAGITTGLPVHAALVGFGLAAILQRSATAFNVIRWAGVVYLAFLGVRSLFVAWRTTQIPDATATASVQSMDAVEGWWSAYRDGLATNLLNPKVALFYLGFLPQFIPPGPAFAGTAIVYGLVHALMGQAQLGTVAVLAEQLRRRLAGAAFRRWTEAVAGTVLLLFSIRLAVSG